MAQHAFEKCSWNGVEGHASHADVAGAPGAAPRQRPADRLENLSEMIEGEIIPRLMLAWRNDRQPLPLSEIQALPTSNAVTAEDVAAFARTTLAADASMVHAFVDGMRTRGVASPNDADALALTFAAPIHESYHPPTPQWLRAARRGGRSGFMAG